MAKVKNVKNLSKAAHLAGVAGNSMFAGTRDAPHIRSSWYITCKNWLRQNRGISLFINPSEVQWSFPRREQMTKTAAGVVRNTWRNRYRNSYFDEPTINITFQAGNIMPSAGLPQALLDDPMDAEFAYQNPMPPPGLLNFYEFMELLDVPMLSGNEENYHVILYRSRIFPRMRLEGYFIGTSPLTLTDSASKGNTFSWTSSFQIYRSYPAYNNFSLLSNEWSNWAKSKVMKSEIFPKNYDFTKLDADAKSAQALTEKGKREKSKLTTLPPNPPDPDDPKGKKKGLVAGSVAGKSTTAMQLPSVLDTAFLFGTDASTFSKVTAGPLTPGVTNTVTAPPPAPGATNAYAAKAATSDPLVAGQTSPSALPQPGVGAVAPFSTK